MKIKLLNSVKKSVLLISASIISVAALAGPVNVNEADIKTLAKELDGVGEKRAAAIVQYREQHGSFKTVNELGKVKGVGSAILEANAENILLK